MMVLKLENVDIIDVHDCAKAALMCQKKSFGLLFAAQECFVGQGFGR